MRYVTDTSAVLPAVHDTSLGASNARIPAELAVPSGVGAAVLGGVEPDDDGPDEDGPGEDGRALDEVDDDLDASPPQPNDNDTAAATTSGITRRDIPAAYGPAHHV